MKATQGREIGAMIRRRARLVAFCWLALVNIHHVKSSDSSLLKDVTQQVFGTDLKRLPVAFGDFNGDKMTDLFVLPETDPTNPNERKSLAVLLAKEDTFSVTSEPKYFGDTGSNAAGKQIKCLINDYNIEAVIPGDFDGDGGMDVLVVTTPDDPDEKDMKGNTYVSFVMWGDHDVKEKRHKLLCDINRHELKMTVHPMIVDVNADYTADLFGARIDANGTELAGAWIFNKSLNRTTPPRFVPLDPDPAQSPQMSRPFHSNAYLDLDGDGNSDLFITAKDRFEVWLNQPVQRTVNVNRSKRLKYNHTNDITLPDCHQNDKCIIGQVSFADIDFNGVIDALVPVCYDGAACTNGTLLRASLKDFGVKGAASFEPVQLIQPSGSNWRFAPYANDEAQNAGIYSPLTIRIGDFNLDGYPDFLIRMKEQGVPKSVNARTHLFLNVEWTGDDVGPPPLGTRGFMLRETVMDSVISGDSDTVSVDVPMATFFDWHEDGIEDIIVVKNKTTIHGSEVTIGAFTNFTLASDAYFVKIIVLSGVCNEPQFKHSCQGGHVEVPYGTNMPGQTVCYRTQKSGQTIGAGSTFVETCAAQLPVSSHSRLMLPYNTFGLGMSPNFLETMNISITNATDHSRSRKWTQIIPNSQLYVIPYPPTRVGDWSMKLFITPSKSILYTGLALIGLCGLIVLIILLLHWREKVADRKEKLQEANRFHFDAM